MEITEKVYQPTDNDVVIHQFYGDEHRIVLHTNEKELESEWMPKDQIAAIDYYEATWEGLVGFSEKDELKSKIQSLLEDYINDLEHLWLSSDSNSSMKGYREKQEECRQALRELA